MTSLAFKVSEEVQGCPALMTPEKTGCDDLDLKSVKCEDYYTLLGPGVYRACGMAGINCLAKSDCQTTLRVCARITSVRNPANQDPPLGSTFLHVSWGATNFANISDWQPVPQNSVGN
mmetsp:Transcript_23518/g.42412  ORF Transcript_23518/g.42412 Transcript_23518/m.42412 type:complete len:118 (-) Transcript_23518:642-995(-)